MKIDDGTVGRGWHGLDKNLENEPMQTKIRPQPRAAAASGNDMKILRFHGFN